MGVTTQRSEFRQRVGRALGRKYYDASTVSTGATVNEIPDPKRTERPAHWDGASIKVGTEAEVYVRGGGGSINTGTGLLCLDRDLAGVPTNGTAYEILKGWTFQDLADSLDWAHKNTWPHFFLPIYDTSTIAEIANTLSYPGPVAWQTITKVSREQVKGATPAWYEEKFEGSEYRIEIDASGNLVLQLLYTPDAGRKIKVEGRQFMTLGAADTSSSVVPWEVIVPGALHYLYDKGISADEMNTALRATFAQESDKQLAIYEQRKVQFKMRQPTRRASFPIISETNTGMTVLN